MSKDGSFRHEGHRVPDFYHCRSMLLSGYAMLLVVVKVVFYGDYLSFYLRVRYNLI